MVDDLILRVDQLSKTYETRAGDAILALSNISFGVGEGEVIGIVGPSGCGKSTLLRIIAGLVRASSGTISIRDGRTEGSAIGIMFQKPVLLPWKTIRENVQLPGQVAGATGPELRQRALSLIDLVGLKGFADTYPSELSGGMQQRAALARCLLQDPSMLLLDEPFGALDAMTRDQMNLEIERVRSATGKTILLVTHSIPEAVFLSDKVVVMSGRPGTIVETIDIDLERPRAIAITGSPQFGHLTNRIRSLLGFEEVDSA